MKMQPLLFCGLPSVSKYVHAKPQSPEECKRASLESSMSLNVKDRGDVYTGGQNPDGSIPALGELKMLASEACHKNYVIFDRCEGKNTVILHPSWLSSPSHNSVPGPCVNDEAKHFGGALQTYDSKWIKDSISFHATAALRSREVQAPVYSEVHGTQSHYLQQRMASSNKARFSVIDLVTREHDQNLKKDVMKSGFLSDIEEESFNEFHENTEEIDALLSSDDELSSTGHSPSDVFSNNLGEAKNGYDNKKTVGKKRKIGYSSLDEVDDADSGPHKLVPDLSFLNSKRSDSSISLYVLSESGPINTFSGVEVSKGCNRCVKSSTVNDVVGEKSECEPMECSGTFGGGPAENSKRIKIKNYVQQLKSVVPGANYLDTTDVLGQTFQYVECLQRRLRNLEAAR